MKPSRRLLPASAALALLLLSAGALSASPATTPADVFDKLRSLEGAWEVEAEMVAGEPEGGAEEEAMVGRFEFRVASNGSVVMETMNAGTPHEMINMYHMDGDDLVLTHYCASGNQPTMKLDAAALAEGKTHFVFTGGTNLDPAVDTHIHSASFNWNEDGTVAADWTGWSGGEEAGVMRFLLARSQ